MGHAPIVRRLATGFAAVSCGLIVAASAASAHVEIDPAEVTAGSAATISLQVGHGCDASPTRELDVQIPAGVDDVTGKPPSGWTVRTDGDVVRFVADEGSELGPHDHGAFPLDFTAPEKPGRLVFKTVQVCVEGEITWIDDWDGTGAEPDNPAPSLTVVAAPGSGGTGSIETTVAPATTVTDDAVDAPTATTTTVVGDHTAAAPEIDDQDDDGSNTGMIAGIVVVVLLVGGGIGYALRRGSDADHAGHDGD